MNKEIKFSIEEIRKTLIQVQIQLDWIDSTIDDLEKTIQNGCLRHNTPDEETATNV